MQQLIMRKFANKTPSGCEILTTKLRTKQEQKLQPKNNNAGSISRLKNINEKSQKDE